MLLWLPSIGIEYHANDAILYSLSKIINR